MKIDNIIKYIFYIIAGILARYDISVFKIEILTILMGIDIATGMLRSFFNLGGRSLKSKVFYAGVSAKILIIILPAILQICALGIGRDFDILVEWTYNSLMVVEVYSIVSNIISLYKGKNMKEYDALTLVLHMIQQLFLKFFEITRVTFEDVLDKTTKGKK